VSFAETDRRGRATVDVPEDAELVIATPDATARSAYADEVRLEPTEAPGWTFHDRGHPRVDIAAVGEGLLPMTAWPTGAIPAPFEPDRQRLWQPTADALLEVPEPAGRHELGSASITVPLAQPLQGVFLERRGPEPTFRRQLPRGTLPAGAWRALLLDDTAGYVAAFEATPGATVALAPIPLPTQTIDGRVVDADGLPVPWARVETLRAFFL
jgi:hypothetical protein